MSNLCCRRPKLDTSRSPIVLSLANCPFPQPFFDHCGAAGAWANGTAGGERRPRYSAFLGMRPTTHLFLPLFLRLCSEDSHTRSLRTSSIFHLFLSTPDVSRLLLPRQASVGGGWRQTGSAVRPWRRCCCRSPVSRDGHNHVSSRPTPIHVVVRNRDGVGSMLKLSAISLLVHMERA